jgi:outer membrane protein assembly factor BamB
MARILTVGAVLILLAACSRKNPATPVAPFADIYNDSLCFCTYTTDPGKLSIQYIFDWGNGEYDTTAFFASGDTGRCCHVFPESTASSISVRARNAAGKWSDWSDASSYSTWGRPGYGDTAHGWGGEPGGWGLRRYPVNRWYRFLFEVGGQSSVSVKFFWGDGRETDWSPFVASGARICDSVNYSTCGEYFVRIALKDRRGTVSGPDTFACLRVQPMAPMWWTEHYGESSPVLGFLNGRLVVYAVCDEEVVCVDAAGGTLWRTEILDLGFYAPALSLDGTRLYVMGQEQLYALDAATGGVRWRFGCVIESGTAPAVGPDGALYVARETDSSYVYELVKVRDLGDSARVEWQVAGMDLSRGVAISSDGVVYVMFVTGDWLSAALSAISPDGSVLWCDSVHLPYSDPPYPPAIDGQGRILAGSEDDPSLYCFNPGGDLAWECFTGWFYPGSIVVGADDRAYVCADMSLTCVDRTGQRSWFVGMPEAAASWSAPCIASDGTIVVYSSSSEYLAGFGPDGSLLWEYSLLDSLGEPGRARRRPRRDEGDMDTSPVIGPDGNLYVVGSEYGLQCFGAGNLKLANTAWPTYAHDPARSGWAGRTW